jgi:hypothetical protein
MLVMVLALTTMRSANADGNELDKIDLSKIRAHEEDIIVRNSQFFVGCKKHEFWNSSHVKHTHTNILPHTCTLFT